MATADKTDPIVNKEQSSIHKDGEIPSEDLRRGIEQLVERLTVIMNETRSISATEDILLNLESTDENFHKYELVKLLRRKIETQLGPLIDDELDRISLSKEAQQDHISNLCNKILSSQEFSNFSHSLHYEIKTIIDDLVQNYHDDIHYHTNQMEGIKTKSGIIKDEIIFLNSSSEDDSEYSSTEDFFFTSQKKLNSIAKNLGKENTKEDRLRAVRALSNMPESDIISGDFWSILFENLTTILSDDDREIAESGLCFLESVLSSSDYLLTTHIYSTLVNYLQSFFADPDNKKYSQEVFDINQTQFNHLLKGMRLMNLFLRDMAPYLVRYSEKFIVTIIESTLKLMNISTSTVQIGSIKVTPMYLIGLIDPNAIWLDRITQGHYTRERIYKYETECKAMIVLAISKCFRVINDFDQEIIIANTKEESDQMAQAAYTYTDENLQYCGFFYSLNVLGNFIYYKGGRQLFPIQLPNIDDFNVEDLLVYMIKLMMAFSKTSISIEDKLNPASVVLRILRRLIANTITCQQCICKERLINVLLSPITSILETGNDMKGFIDNTFVYVIEILMALSASSPGFEFLINWKVPIRILVQFTKELLKPDKSAQKWPPKYVVKIMTFFRHLYQTCIGFSLLEELDSHDTLLNFPCKVKDLSSTATSSSNLDSQLVNWDPRLLWQLIDCITYYAMTPKGVLKLESHDALVDCVNHIYYICYQDIQILEHEKLPYYIILTNITSTPPGINALLKTDYMKYLASDIWSAFEAQRPDDFFIIPQTFLYLPGDPMDKKTYDVFIAIIRLLSSFPAVYEILLKETLSREESLIPVETLEDIIQRMILIDIEEQTFAECDYSQWHLFGLRLLEILTTCLDTYLFLESRYGLQKFLLERQEICKICDSDEFIADVHSIERNRILVRISSIGGPTERHLPTRDISNPEDLPPQFSCLPLPSYYLPDMQNQKSSVATEIIEVIRSQEELSSEDWLRNCKDAFYRLITLEPEKLVGAATTDSDLSRTQAFDRTNDMISKGIYLVINYGQRLHLLEETPNNYSNLSSLYHRFYDHLKVDSSNKYTGFDWFAATVYLMLRGNSDLTWDFLCRFSTTLSSLFLWMPRVYAGVTSSPLLDSEIHPTFSIICHEIDRVLQLELPLVHSAFLMAGYPVSQICQHWLRQMFWNFLDWQEICYYLSICIILGADYQVYFCISILRHLQDNIIEQTQNRTLIPFLKGEPIRNFTINNYIASMKEMEIKYRTSIMTRLIEFSKIILAK
ncbi:Protein broad-minded [Trichoplax sp. H2]|nr:Protein broad-minded [Trichoplax sp. H2]|eukprot:RDD47429.1 Protein broad-minded [Trichoplax sp. H2]